MTPGLCSLRPATQSRMDCSRSREQQRQPWRHRSCRFSAFWRLFPAQSRRAATGEPEGVCAELALLRAILAFHVGRRAGSEALELHSRALELISKTGVHCEATWRVMLAGAARQACSA